MFIGNLDNMVLESSTGEHIGKKQVETQTPIYRAWAFPPWGEPNEVPREEVIAMYEDQKVQQRIAKWHFFGFICGLEERSLEEVYASHGRDSSGEIIKNPENLLRTRAYYGLNEHGE
jgi:hypothetical protein